MRLKKAPVLLLLLLLSVLLLVNAKQAVLGAQQGLAACAQLVIPSLLPFFILSGLLVSMQLEQLLLPLMGKGFARLFALPPQGLPALLFGLLGGYPLGVKTLAQQVAQRSLTATDARRLLRFCNNTGPAFFIGAVGIALFQSSGIGLCLYGLHLLSALLTGRILKNLRPARYSPYALRLTATAPKPLATALPEVFTSSCQSLLTICCYVVFFSSLLSVLQALPFVSAFFALLGRQAPALAGSVKALAAGFLEMTSGIAQLQDCASLPLRFCLSACIVTWGGLCVHLQSLALLTGSDIASSGYLKAKLLQSLLVLLLAVPCSLLLFGQRCALSPGLISGLTALCIGALLFFLLFSKTFQKRTSISPQNLV